MTSPGPLFMKSLNWRSASVTARSSAGLPLRLRVQKREGTPQRPFASTAGARYFLNEARRSFSAARAFFTASRAELQAWWTVSCVALRSAFSAFLAPLTCFAAARSVLS